MPPAPGLLAILRALADRDRVDWDGLESSHDEADFQAIARELKIVDRITSFHRSLQASPDVAATSSWSSGSSGADLDRTRIDAALDYPPTWGPLTLLERVGRGSFADVYRAWDTRLDREVALKVLRDPDRASGGESSSVIGEARLLAKVRHPNVVTVHGAERIDGQVGIWTEFVHGHTLAHLVRQQGPFSADEATAIGIDLCRALAAVHRAGLLHRDVKAQNVMREQGGRIVLMDLGAGKERRNEPARPGEELTGTPLYLSPEAWQGADATPQTEIYSLGVLLYYLVTGTYPVHRATLQEVREAHQAGRRTLLRDARPDLPNWFIDAVERALAVDPSARYESAGAFETALKQAHRVTGHEPVERADLPNRPPAITESALAPDPPTRFVSAEAMGTAIGGLATNSASSAARVGVSVAILVALVLAAVAIGKWRAARDDGPARSHPRDAVLITRFENRTGDPVFDGSMEYAFERDLGDSNVIQLVSPERVRDTLVRMRRARDTTVDRTVGREVALRDGHIKFLLAGRVEKFGEMYIITAQIVDSATDAPAATLRDEVRGLGQVPSAIGRLARLVRLKLGERADRIKEIDQENEQVTTRSLKAFRLYQQSYEFLLNGRVEAALELARQTVAEDPEFATGWIQLAWATVRTRIPPGRRLAETLVSDKYQSVTDEIRPFRERALSLAQTSSEWERYWILGSYYVLSADPGRSIPFWEALLRIRPEHYFAANNLRVTLRSLDRSDELVAVEKMLADANPQSVARNYDAAVAAIEAADFVTARRYAERAKLVLPARETDDWIVSYQRKRVDVEWLPLYLAWSAGDLPDTLARLEQMTREFPTRASPYREHMALALHTLNFTLGRFNAGMPYVTQGAPEGQYPVWAAFAEYLRDDVQELRRELRSIPASRWPRVLRGNAFLFTRAGLHADARELLEAAISQGADMDPDQALGDLQLLNGHPREAIPLLQKAVGALKKNGSRPHDYYNACESVATALERAGRQADAIEQLEACAQQRPQYLGAVFLGPPFWMHLLSRLADEYREAGRLADAQKIENQLRMLLVYADADHPLLKRLNGR